MQFIARYFPVENRKQSEVATSINIFLEGCSMYNIIAQKYTKVKLLMQLSRSVQRLRHTFLSTILSTTIVPIKEEHALEK